MRILKLTLNKKWYDMILRGEKKEEYREIKPYWVSRLTEKNKGCIIGDLTHGDKNNAYTMKNFDAVKFTNGYRKNSPSFLIELEKITIDGGISYWGAKRGNKYFVLSLGKIIK